jgi:hypothetical protein
MFNFENSRRKSLPSLSTGLKEKLRALHLRSRSLNETDVPSSSPHHSYDEFEEDPFGSGPSQSFWRYASSPSTTAPGAHVIGRSFSSPLLSTQYQTDVYTHAPYPSAHSLWFDPRYAAGGQSAFPVAKPLSPIAEQDYFSPDKQPMGLPPDDTASTPTGSQYSGIARMCCGSFLLLHLILGDIQALLRYIQHLSPVLSTGLSVKLRHEHTCLRPLYHQVYHRLISGPHSRVMSPSPKSGCRKRP